MSEKSFPSLECVFRFISGVGLSINMKSVTVGVAKSTLVDSVSITPLGRDK